MWLSGKILEWLRPFLYGRTHRVKIGETYSNEVILEFGVMQGSVLFNIYIHSPYKTVQSKSKIDYCNYVRSSIPSALLVKISYHN